MTAYVGYNERPQFQLDIEHPASSVVFGAEVFDDNAGTSVEYSYTYGTDSEVTKLATPAITGGESYVLTLPPVGAGRWEVTARTNFGTVLDVAKIYVQLPENSKLVTP